MILVADSGSTKTDWRLLLPEGKIQQARTAGYNPHHQSSEEIRVSLEAELPAQLPEGEQIEEIYFYGAGCSSEGSRNEVKQAFLKVFPNAKITIEHDLLAAARALCGEEAGIACILGTGSNSCLYDGEKIVDNVPALGYILGDEGSGTDLGKRVVADYLRRDMPDHLRQEFEAEFQLTAEEVLHRLYKKPFGKPYLASFAKFLANHPRDPYAYRLVHESFSRFLSVNVKKYAGHDQLKVHFVGSVAFYFNSILRQASADLGLTVGNILETPIAGLTLYHQQNHQA